MSVYCFSKQPRFLIHFTDVAMTLFEGPVVEVPGVTGPPQQGLPRTLGQVGEPPPALGWASTPSILCPCVSLCWSGITAWGFLLSSYSPIAPGRGPENRPGPSTCVPLAEPSDTPRPYFFFQGPRPPTVYCRGQHEQDGHPGLAGGEAMSSRALQ